MLSDQERRRLEDIEQRLSHDDPALARRVARLLPYLDRRRSWLHPHITACSSRTMRLLVTIAVVVAAVATTTALLLIR
jgi:hypothetical protein